MSGEMDMGIHDTMDITFHAYFTFIMLDEENRSQVQCSKQHFKKQRLSKWLRIMMYNC